MTTRRIRLTIGRSLAACTAPLFQLASLAQRHVSVARLLRSAKQTSTQPVTVNGRCGCRNLGDCAASFHSYTSLSLVESKLCVRTVYVTCTCISNMTVLPHQMRSIGN